MQEQYQTNLVHLLTLRERQRLSHEASQPLAQSAIPALHMIGLAALLAYCLVPIFRKDLLVALPKIAVEYPLSAITLRNTLPKLPTSLLASVAYRVSYHLTGAPTQRQPDPAFAPLFVDE